MSASATPAGLSPIPTESSNDKSADDQVLGVALAAVMHECPNPATLQETVIVFEHFPWNDDGVATHTTTKELFYTVESDPYESGDEGEEAAEKEVQQALLDQAQVKIEAAEIRLEVRRASLLMAKQRKLRKAYAASNASNASGESCNGSVRSRTSRRDRTESERNSGNGSTRGRYRRRMVGADHRHDLQTRSNDYLDGLPRKETAIWRGLVKGNVLRSHLHS